MYTACLALLAFSAAADPTDAARIAFTVSLARPIAHTFHVEMLCEGIRDEVVELKMPAWSPGYYVILDYAKNVSNLRARDASGRTLPWEKTAKNAWRVTTAGASPFTVSYDVWALGSSIAESSLDERQAFLSPTSLFLHPAGRIRTPATVTVEPFDGWHRISTGLDPVKDRPNTFAAPDFDVLYDSPLLAGNQEVLSFDVNGVPHTFEGRDLGALDRARFVADLKAMVGAAVGLMGEIPYSRYAFISIGPGGGGLEHLNSQVITFDAGKLADPAEYARTLRFITHEYFHNFNVKRIRPVALGPFDYDRENYTRMMWVSEGFTVYYEDLLLARNGFYGADQYLERLAEGLSSYENAPGRHFQSPADSSFDSWFGYFNRNEHLQNTTVSPYDSGLVLALLIDFRIRHETRNRTSLDDVMRTLYRTWAKGKGRGFTDQEFRQVCESTAGVPLSDIFDEYVATTKEIDYSRYLGYAGLALENEPAGTAGELGADVEDRNGRVFVTRVGIGSPASLAGLSVQDEVLALDTTRCDARKFRELVASRGSAKTVRLLVSRHDTTRELAVIVGPKTSRTFRLRRLPETTPLQKAIFDGWLSGRSTRPAISSRSRPRRGRSPSTADERSLVNSGTGP